MTKRTMYTSTLVAVLVLTLGAWSYADSGWGHGYGMMDGSGYGYHMGNGNARNQGGCYGNGPGNRGLYSQLTPEKQAAAEKVFETYGEKFSTLRDKMQVKRLTLESLVNSGKADEAKIEKLVGDISKLRDEIIGAREQMGKDLEKATGIAMAQNQSNFGPGNCPGYGSGNGNNMMGPGYGMGPGGRN